MNPFHHKTQAGAVSPKANLTAVATVAATAVVLFMSASIVSGCKEDCSGPARLGDFEFSQGNYVNAVKQYEKALRADAKCGVVGEKLAEAKRKVAAGK